MRNIHLILTVISIFFLSYSCKTKQNLIYFQDNGKDTINAQNFSIQIKTGDLLAIDVYGVDPEMVNLLNQNFASTNQLPTYANGIAPKTGYLVDEDGNINFPEVGKINLSGKTITQANETILASLNTIVKNARVLIRIQNFKITILGDVKVPGTYNIPNERITITEAIGLAGDLNITGVRKNILVIRDVDGIKKEYRLDLTSKNIFNSEVYYLTQNDMIYVEPNRAKRNSSIISSAAGVFISIASLIITTVNLITK